MPERHRPIRPLAEQFEQSTVNKVRALQRRIGALGIKHHASRYLLVELDRCLEAGLLYAALSVGTGLLELLLRSAVIQCRLTTTPLADGQAARRALQELIKDTEGNRRLTLAPLAEQLLGNGILSDAECSMIKNVNSELRVPLHHGLIARYVRQRNAYDFLEELGLSDSLSAREIEEIIKNSGLSDLATVVEALEVVVSKALNGSIIQLLDI